MNLVYGRQFAWAWMKEHWAELFEKFGTGGSFTLPRLVSYSTKTLATAAEAVRRPAPRPLSNIMLGKARLRVPAPPPPPPLPQPQPPPP